MARARNIKPGFFKNEDLAECDAWARLCFAGLWTLADREGRLEDRPKRIKAELFAFDSIDVEPLLDDLERHGFILRYSVDGNRFLQIVTFSKHQNPHQRESKSEIPRPEGSVNRFNHDPVTAEQRLRILERDEYKCQRCEATTTLQIDHIIARARGGTSDDANLQILCAACNVKKCAKDEAKAEPRIDLGYELSTTSTDKNHSLGTAKDAPEDRQADLAGGSSRADSLFSDSLISESGTLIPEEKKGARKRAQPSFDASGIEVPDWLDRDLWTEWAADRKERGKPITERAAKQQIATLDEFRRAGHTPERTIRHAIGSGNRGLYVPPKLTSGNGLSARERDTANAAARVRDMTGGRLDDTKRSASDVIDMEDPNAARIADR